MKTSADVADKLALAFCILIKTAAKREPTLAEKDMVKIALQDLIALAQSEKETYLFRVKQDMEVVEKLWRK